MHISAVVAPNEASWKKMECLMATVLKRHKNCKTEVRWDNSGADHPFPYPFVEVSNAGNKDGRRFGDEAIQLLKRLADE